MHRRSFNADWKYRAGLTAFEDYGGVGAWTPVTLPHDAMRDLERSADVPDKANSGFFPGGYFQYSKTFDVPADYRDKTVSIEFEGVYRDATVFINGEYAGQRPYGYSRFRVLADPYLVFGAENTITVESRAHLDSRWYTGAGIYRDTHLLVGALTHIAADGVRVTTADLDDEYATVEVEVLVRNDERTTRTVRVDLTILDAAGGVAATATSPITLLPATGAKVRLRTLIADPELWDTESPHLYRAESVLRDGEHEIDSDSTAFGVRTLALDAARGLRLNGRTVKLRGACIHHDNGILGARTIRRAEERRIEILKEAGFNAIRSAHNPLSVAMLDACDRLGMLVMDEAFDVWTQPKTAFDYSSSFPEWWERDIESMVEKDVNHPSVVLYSIGNEIFEVGTGVGSTWTRTLAEKIRELDPTRYVTNGVNSLVAADYDDSGLQIEPTSDPTDVNRLLMQLSEHINEQGATPQASAMTEESHAAVDIAGMNYSDARYVPDREAYPNRVILGTETFPGRIDVLWPLVEGNPHVIGDFAWTGWDYLGEVGAGRIDYPDEDYVDSGFLGVFPWLTAGLGDIDIVGHRNPISYYRETVYGLRRRPYIAVHRPERHGQPVRQSPWSWGDVVSSWTWAVEPGSPVIVDVYSDADEVELLLDGETIGRRRVGEDKARLARFDTVYRPGRLEAVAYREGVAAEREVLATAADDVALTVSIDRDEIRGDDQDLAFVAIELADSAGVLATDRDLTIRVTVTGAGALAGLGTGRKSTEERFDASECTTLDGRALAVIRPTGAGAIEVTVRADGYEGITRTVTAS